MLLFFQGLFTVRIMFFDSAVLPLRLEPRFYLWLPCFDTYLLSMKPLAIGHQTLPA